MSSGVVTFNYSSWAARYPELSASVGAPLAQLYFDEATLYCNNTPCGIVSNLVTRATLLNMLTAHICAMNATLNNVPPSPIVGRMSNASEGSVSVSSEMNYPAGTPQWFQQTRYGAAYWAATVQYRMMAYVPGPVPVFNQFGARTIVTR